MPSARAFGWTAEASIIVPAVTNLNDFSWNGEFGNMLAVGRLNKGVTFKRAQDELSILQQEVKRIVASAGGNPPTAEVQPLQQAIVADSKNTLWLLMAAVASITLIACVNLANANLGRALARQREAAVRRALGASSLNLFLHGLAESFVVALIGGLAGFALAGLAAGILPALGVARTDPQTALRSDTRTGASKHTVGLRRLGSRMPA